MQAVVVALVVLLVVLLAVVLHLAGGLTLDGGRRTLRRRLVGVVGLFRDNVEEMPKPPAYR